MRRGTRCPQAQHLNHKRPPPLAPCSDVHSHLEKTSSRFNSVGRSNTRRAVSDGILPPEEGIRVTRHRWLSTVNVRWHFKPSPFVVHVSGSKIYHMVLTRVRVMYANSLQIKRENSEREKQACMGTGAMQLPISSRNLLTIRSLGLTPYSG